MSSVKRAAWVTVAVVVWAFVAMAVMSYYGAPLRAQAVSADVVETADAADKFETLLKLLKAADMVDRLKGEGPFTLFAPTDQAFADLPEGVVEELLMPENKQVLTQLLDYHLVPGRLLVGDIEGIDDLESAAGDFLSIEIGEQFWVDEAVVTERDIEASNGVIHAIDKVVTPRDLAL